MFRTLRWVVPALVIFAVVAPDARAQFQMPPEVRAKMDAWRKWRENNKHVAALQQTLSGIVEMEKDEATKLTKDQAKKILAVVKANQKKPVLKNDAAKEVNKALTGPLTPAQLIKIATAPQPGRGRMGGAGGGGAGGGQRPAGGGGPGGGAARAGGPGGFDMSKFPDPKDYNPLNPDTLPFEPMRPMAKQRMGELMGKLEARAK